jgi:hypothetical protein
VLNGQGNPVHDCKVQAELIGNKVIFIDTQGNRTSVGSDPIRTETDVNGTWALTLIQSARLYQGGSTTGGVKYQIVLKGKGMDEKKDVLIPSTGTAKYEEL